MKLFEGFILFFCFSLASFLISFYFIKYKDFREGLDHIKNKNYVEAQDIFSNLISLDELNLPARFNLALAKLLRQKPEEALNEYEKIIKLSNRATTRNIANRSIERYMAYFNSGFIKGFQNIDEALEFYQKALNENKNSVATKTNIELLLKEKQKKESSQESNKDSQDKNSQKQEEPQKSDESSEDSQKQEESDESGQDPQKQEESQQGESSQEPQELSSEQIENILKEIDNNEQKLKMRLNQVPEKDRGKQW